jgi:hypothetical protein
MSIVILIRFIINLLTCMKRNNKHNNSFNTVHSIELFFFYIMLLNKHYKHYGINTLPLIV